MNCLQTITQAVNAHSLPVNGSDGRGTVIAAIGSGGKTTLLRALADEAVAQGKTAILATTTHFLPFEDVPTFDTDSEFELKRQLERQMLVCAATKAKGAKDAGKLGPSKIDANALAGLANYLLVEADGSRRLPLKAHADHEPQVPACADIEALVLGASAFGKTVEESAHRTDLFCERAGCEPQDIVTPEVVARHIAAEVDLGLVAPNVIVVNQAESPELLDASNKLSELLKAAGLAIPILAGSLRAHKLQAL